MFNYDDYKIWLRNRLNEIKADLDFSDYKIEVFSEQDFTTDNSIKDDVISVVIKFLASDMVYFSKMQPIQMLVLAEENSLAVANSIFTSFTERYNLYQQADNTTRIKHQYATPTILNNFNLVGNGLRSVLYINTTLFILEGVMDLNNLTIDADPLNNKDGKVDVLSATFGYTMSGDTQPFNDGGYATTIKNFSTFVMTLNVVSVKNDFTEKCLKIVNGSSTYKGNDTFVFSFTVGELSFSLNMKMTGLTFTTAPNSIPSLQISFSV